MSENDSLRAELTRNFELLQWRSEQEYDGVLGTLPEWMPKNFHSEFSSIRTRLLNEGYSVSDLHLYIAEVIEINNIAAANAESENPPTFHPYTPSNIWGDITTLGCLQKAFQLGEEQGLISLIGEALAKSTMRGRKVLKGAAKGHEATHGDAQQKAEEWCKYQAEVDRLAHENPRLSFIEMKRKAARKFDVSESTIKRHTQNPKRKK